MGRLVSIQVQVDKDAVIAINIGCANGFADDGQDTAPILARAFGNELLNPIAKTGDGWREEEGEFVTPVLRQFTQHHPQATGVVIPLHGTVATGG